MDRKVLLAGVMRYLGGRLLRHLEGAGRRLRVAGHRESGVQPPDVAVFTHRSIVSGRAADVFQWHERPEALLDLIPSRRWVRIESRTGGLHDDGRVAFSVGFGPLRVRWEARHYGYIRNKQFCDEQIRGPFAVWRHTHRFEPFGIEETLYEDSIEYALRGGAMVRRLARLLLRHLLSRAFARRHQIVRASFADARDSRLRARHVNAHPQHVGMSGNLP